MIKRSKGKFGLVVLLTLILVMGSILGACAPEASPPPAEKPPAEKPPAEAPKPPPAEEKVIKIGTLWDITGPYSAGFVLDGASDYYKWLNDEKGGIEGIKVEHLWVDHRANADVAISAYMRMKGDVLLFNTLSSVETTALKAMFEKDGVPCITTAASETVTPGPTSTWVYCHWGPTYQTSLALVNWFKGEWKEKRLPRVGIITWDSAYGKAPIPAVKGLADQGEIEYVGAEFVAYGAVDNTVELSRLKKEGADFILIGVSGPQPGAILKDGLRLGFPQAGIKFGAHHGAFLTMAIPLAGDAAEGWLGGMVLAIPTEDVPSVKLLKRVCQEYHGKEIDSDYIIGWHHAWVSSEAVRAALKKVGYDGLNGKAVKEALDNLKFDTEGLSGGVDFTNLGDKDRIALNKARIFVVENGKMIPTTDWIPAPEPPTPW